MRDFPFLPVAMEAKHTTHICLYAHHGPSTQTHTRLHPTHTHCYMPHPLSTHPPTHCYMPHPLSTHPPTHCYMPHTLSTHSHTQHTQQQRPIHTFDQLDLRLCELWSTEEDQPPCPHSCTPVLDILNNKLSRVLRVSLMPHRSLSKVITQ